MTQRHARQLLAIHFRRACALTPRCAPLALLRRCRQPVWDASRAQRAHRIRAACVLGCVPCAG
jgi:hypothetical protein